ncbi:MAG: phosphopantothenate synthase, partial [Burkholderiales bacterium]|nr:phosphopantothenate synthase [Burkholderiales bacterium]
APYCVGFAAETENLHEYAQAKRASKKIPLLAANLAHNAFGRDENELILFHDEGETRLPRASKLEVARGLIREIAARLPNR